MDLNNRIQTGVAYHQSGRLADAEEIYLEVLAAQPNQSDALHLLGVLLYQKKDYSSAEAFINKSIQINPGNPAPYSNLGIVYRVLKKYDDALASYSKAVKIKPDYAEAYNNRGNVFQDMKFYDEALLDYDMAASINGNFADPICNKANIFNELKKYKEALYHYELAINIKTDYYEAYNNRGNTYYNLKKYNQALADYERAIELNGFYAEAINNKANVLRELRKLNEALSVYDNSLKILPGSATILSNRGNVLRDLGKIEDAIKSYEVAIELDSENADAIYNYANILLDTSKLQEALKYFELAFKVNPKLDYLAGIHLHVKLRMCIWNDFEREVENLCARLHASERITPPFPLLAIVDDPALHLKCANLCKEHKYPTENEVFAFKSSNSKLKIGYYSSDYYSHATAFLMAELFESHDRDEFEIHGFSFGPMKDDSMTDRLKIGFDYFYDVSKMSDFEISEFSRAININIAVDLKGYTQDARPGIFSRRCAPIQVSYLGYPGTMGAEYFDYVVADQILIPEELVENYSEKIVFMPDSYQVNDSKRKISEKNLSRADVGLPENGFVFCSFNNSYKILPDIFSCWMRILLSVEGSVLWLLEDNPTARQNLCREAELRGVASSRLVFAQRIGLEEHLARQRLADLFLDTLPYNAHTTASDALWVGLPVLTRCGQSFASRVAASLLHAAGLPELVVQSQEEYESLAIGLAHSPERLSQIREILQCNRDSSPLFDATRFARNLESAYEEMHSRFINGLAADHIFVRG